jgi:RNA polymerase sigma factor for flagellar operon FliA
VIVSAEAPEEVAAKLYAGRPTQEFEFDEYLQYATVGLIECVDRYDPSYGAAFRTYAGRRVTGAILNGLEHSSEKQQQVAFRKRVAAERVESVRGDEPMPESPEDLFANLARIAVTLALGYVLEDSGMYRPEDEAPSRDSSYEAIELKQLQRRVRALVEALPERERRIIHYHYLNHLPFEYVADVLGVSKGRVSQLHRRAMELLRDEARKVKKCDLAW